MGVSNPVGSFIYAGTHCLRMRLKMIFTRINFFRLARTIVPHALIYSRLEEKHSPFVASSMTRSPVEPGFEATAIKALRAASLRVVY